MPTSANEFEQFRSGEPPAALWGEADSGGVVTPPAAPTLSVSGTTATIAGSTAGSTNVLTVSLAVAGTGFTWATEGSRTGDGDIALTLDAGYYWGIVTSTTADGSAVSNLVYFRIGDFSGDLDHSPADIVRYLLIALGHGTLPPATDWPIYEGAEPTAPDALVTTYNVTGVDQGRSQIDGQRYTREGVQIRIRGADHPSAFAKSREIAVAIDEDVLQETVVIGASTYFVHAISRTSGPLALGHAPGSKRFLFTINCLVNVRQLT